MTEYVMQIALDLLIPESEHNYGNGLITGNNEKIMGRMAAGGKVIF